MREAVGKALLPGSAADCPAPLGACVIGPGHSHRPLARRAQGAQLRAVARRVQVQLKHAVGVGARVVAGAAAGAAHVGADDREVVVDAGVAARCLLARVCVGALEPVVLVLQQRGAGGGRGAEGGAQGAGVASLPALQRAGRAQTGGGRPPDGSRAPPSRVPATTQALASTSGLQSYVGRHYEGLGPQWRFARRHSSIGANAATEGPCPASRRPY